MPQQNKVSSAVLALLFPKRCLWCGSVVGFSACPACAQQARLLEMPPEPLALAAHHNAAFLDAAWACWRYEGPVQDALHRLKYNDDPGLAVELAGAMAARALACGLPQQFQVVMPVPMAPKARRRRGYNQTLLLAQKICAATGMELCANALQKSYDTPSQSGLPAERRGANVMGVFRVTNAAAVAGKQVLLVDDIITTGATLNECAKMLLAAGAAGCGVLCAAATREPEQPVP